jgi:hypothetical protein
MESYKLKKLVKLGHHLDRKGLQKEADIIDSFVKESFVKESGLVTMVGAWVSEQLSTETLAEIADKMDAKRLAEVAKAMDPEKQKEIIRILVQDPEIRAVAFEALSIDPNLGNLGFDVLRGLQEQGLDTKNLPPEVSALMGSGAGAASDVLKELQDSGLFGPGLQKGDPIKE